MKRWVTLGLAVLAMGLSGCENVDLETAMQSYAERGVAFNLENATVDSDGSVVLKSSLEFTHLVHFTNQRTECDTVQCGTDTRQECTAVQRCENVYQCWNEQRCYPEQVCRPVQRCHGGGQVCTNQPVCRDVRDTVCRDVNGQQVCEEVTRRECRDQQVCRPQPPVCHYENVCHTENRCRYEQQCGYRPQCRTDQVCRDVEVPRYCQVNCRQVPYEDSRVDKHPSSITLRVKGLSRTEWKKQLRQLVLAIKPNAAFQSAIDNPAERPKGSDAIFNSVTKLDKTIAIAKAKGFHLAKGQAVLELPANFKPGDAIDLVLVLEPTSAKEQLSAAGTKTDLPALHWVD
ncbi:MAG TPA: hypothetical protein VM598_07105 [Bdellovibrionota bacterium]|nr:hypothetical protein [Bdellovibrionota bacterium]